MNAPNPSFPTFTAPAPVSAEERKAILALEEQTYEIAFEGFLEQMAGGTPLDRAIREYHTPIVPARFRAWVYGDPKRKQAYMVAKALGAEAVEDELIRISDGIAPDGSASPNDVARSTLQINTRKWLLQVWNRKRYGDSKHVTTNSTMTNVDVQTLDRDTLQRQILEGLGLTNNTTHPQSAVFDNDDPFDDN